MQTASFKSTTLQTQAAVANTLSASEISLNGVDVVQSIQEKGGKALNNLISRELVNDEDYYIIWDDSGQPLDVKLPEEYCPTFTGCSGLKTWRWDLSSVKDTINTFQSCLNLESFEGDLSELINGTNMFMDCTSLKTFNSSLNSLIDGWDMFSYCKLDKTSVQNIINCLRTTNVLSTTGTITIGIDKTFATDSEFLSFLGIESGTNQSISITTPVRTLEDGTTVGGGTWTVQFQFN